MPSTQAISRSPFDWALYDVVVDSQGHGDFVTVGDALAAAPDDEHSYVIYIKNGIYQERLNITRAHVHLLGEHRDHTIILGICANGLIRQDGKIPGTYGSRTVNVDSRGFKASHLTIKNGFDYAANFAKHPDDPSKIAHTQAVALLIGAHGDCAEFHDVVLDSYHDTLYVSAGRSYFERCTIFGTVDFIFGGGTALFRDCDIVARYRIGTSADEPMGFISAPCTHISQTYGLIFERCRLTKEPQVPKRSYALGRPWHPTTEFADGAYADPNAIGQCLFSHCQFDDHIADWEKMAGKDVHGQTQWFTPEQARFYEWQNWQTQIPRSAKAPYQISAEQVSEYTLDNIFVDWRPDFAHAKHRHLEVKVRHPLLQLPLRIELTDRFGQRVVTQSQSQVTQIEIQQLQPPILISAQDPSQSLILHALWINHAQHTSSVSVNLLSDLVIRQLLGQELMSKFNHSALIVSKRAWHHAHKDTFHALRELA